MILFIISIRLYNSLYILHTYHPFNTPSIFVLDSLHPISIELSLKNVMNADSIIKEKGESIIFLAFPQVRLNGKFRLFLLSQE